MQNGKRHSVCSEKGLTDQFNLNSTPGVYVTYVAV